MDEQPRRLIHTGVFEMRIMVVTVLSLLAALAASSMRAQNAGPLAQCVRSEESACEPGEAVKLIYSVKNAGKRPVTYIFSSSKQFDLWLRRDDKEVYRHSKGRLYAQMVTRLNLKPGELKTYEVTWNQKDNDGHDVGPGVYQAYAQLTPQGKAPPPAEGKVRIGERTPVVAVTVREAIRRADKLKDRRVRISATYRGWQPNPNDPNTRQGPPVTRSDWAICDSTGSMYVSGSIDLSPSKDIGAKLTAIGKLARTPKGQVYLILESATVEKKAS